MFGSMDQLFYGGSSISKMKEEHDRRERAETALARVEHKAMIYRDFIASEMAARDVVQKQLDLGRDIESSHRLKGADAARLLSLLAGYDWTIASAKETLEHWIGEVERAKENLKRVTEPQSDSYKPAPTSAQSEEADERERAEMAAMVEALRPAFEGQADWVKKHGEPQPILRSGRW